MMGHEYPGVKPTLEKKINQYITLKLERGKTFIYVNGNKFIQCIRLVLNIRKDDIPLYDEIESIDEAAKVYKNHIYQNRIIRGPGAVRVRDQVHDIAPEQEFWGHCSNLQAWVENKYDTRILMSNISFPLLRSLSKAGDPVAKKVYKEEIALRLESGYPSVVQYLLAQGYIEEFSQDEFKMLLQTTGLFQKVSSDKRVLTSLLNTCIRKFPTLNEDIVLQVLNLPESKELLLSIIKRPLWYRQLPGFLGYSRQMNTAQSLTYFKTVLEKIFKKIEESKREPVLDCIKAINEQLIMLEKYSEMYNSYTSAGEMQRLRMKKRVPSTCKYCGKMIPNDRDVCEWCGHKKDDNDRGGFFPYPFIFKPPGDGGGSMKSVAIVTTPTKSKT